MTISIAGLPTPWIEPTALDADNNSSGSEDNLVKRGRREKAIFMLA